MAKTTPIKNPEEIQQNPDQKIDQDYPGFPHAPSTEERIQPHTTTEEKGAVIKKDDNNKTYGGKTL